MLRAPDSWPQPVVAALAMAVLAIIDLAGAIVAKEAVDRRSLPLAALGAGLFVLLFWVYASSLAVAELAPVTFGWIVILQIGVLLVDRFRYEVSMPTGKWMAVVVLIVAQAYLLLGPSGSPQQSASGPGALVIPSPRPAPEPTAELGEGSVPAPRARGSAFVSHPLSK